MAASWFAEVKVAEPIEVFSLTDRFKVDAHPDKVNLGVGAYRDDEGNPYVLPVVRAVESQMAADQTLNHEYLPVPGYKTFREECVKLLLSPESPAITECRADGVQAIGGTGAIRIGLDFLHSRLGCDTVYVTKPTWGNHKNISKSLGYQNILEYRYWDNDRRCLDIEGLLEDLKNAPERSVIILHMCAHNPSGIDPTNEQWARIAEVMREKKLFPFFDCAYQGFASGDVDKDAFAVRHFVTEGFEFLAAQSFSKNFGLYNERVGNLTFVVNNADKLHNVRSQLEIVVRTTWSNSSNHGARIVATVLNNPALHAEWLGTLKSMANRILQMRDLLYQRLRALGTPGTWDHIVQQNGMFSYTGLSVAQSKYLIEQYHIYLLKSGRINMCALTTKNIDYVANAIHDAVTSIKSEDHKL